MTKVPFDFFMMSYRSLEGDKSLVLAIPKINGKVNLLAAYTYLILVTELENEWIKCWKW